MKSALAMQEFKIKKGVLAKSHAFLQIQNVLYQRFSRININELGDWINTLRSLVLIIVFPAFQRPKSDQTSASWRLNCVEACTYVQSVSIALLATCYTEVADSTEQQQHTPDSHFLCNVPHQEINYTAKFLANDSRDRYKRIFPQLIA